MSSYFEMLSGRGRDRYRAKLEAVGLSLNDDSYMAGVSDKWRSDMTYWPKIIRTHLRLLHFKTWNIHSGAVALMEAARSL